MEKQIEEIDTLTSVIWEANHKKSVLDYHWIATEVYKAGYRKASEVAREIFAEIQKIIEVDKFGEAKFDVRELYKIEKKYESEDNNNGQK